MLLSLILIYYFIQTNFHNSKDAFKLFMIQSNNDDINKANKLLKKIFSFSDAFIIKKNVFKYLTWKYRTEIILI